MNVVLRLPLFDLLFSFFILFVFLQPSETLLGGSFEFKARVAKPYAQAF